MFNFQELPSNVRSVLEENIKGYSVEKDTIGGTRTVVYHFKAQDRTSLYLKINLGDIGSNLKLESEVLSWLEGKLPCPQVISYECYQSQEYLLVTGIKGKASFICSNDEERQESIRILVKGLNLIHSVDITDCPFDRTLNFEMENAKRRMNLGLVNENNFDAQRRGRTAESLYEELLRTKPRTEDLVFTHGDYCLPNILIDKGELSGFIDWEKGGVSDRHQDIALCLRSVIYNFGEDWGLIFLKELGLDIVDQQKIKFYQLLDEFY
ncbi:MAG: aminoglycoside 3'-phosphotransferase [Candidatus Heimdallarchaeota archaeon]|nr:aminoglycoside 3'-phosphotransferase [Candidatus Heimdallarchaeota archaeon]